MKFAVALSNKYTCCGTSLGVSIYIEKHVVMQIFKACIEYETPQRGRSYVGGSDTPLFLAADTDRTKEK